MTAVSKLLTRSATPDGEERRVDVPHLVAYLLLFDRFTMKTDALREIPGLIRVFGPEGLKTLMEAGLLRFTSDAFTIAHKNSYQPSLEYDFVRVAIADRKSYISRNLSRIPTTPGLNFREGLKLKPHVAAAIVDQPSESEQRRTLQRFYDDLRAQSNLLRLSIARLVAKTLNIALDSDQIDVATEQINDTRFRFRTNLGELLDIPQEQVYSLIGSSALALSNRWMVILDMERHHALSGARPDELPILDPRLSVVETAVDPKPLVEQFYRVARLAGAPVAESNSRIDAARLARVHRSPEAAEFRSWLHSAENIPDEAIQEAFSSLVGQLGIAIRRPVGRFLRWLVATAAGVNPLTGAAVGAVDSLLFEQLFPTKGPVVFLSDLYPSLILPPP